MDNHTKWHDETIGHKVVESLNANRFKAEYAADKKEALEKALALVAGADTVACAGSMTRFEIGLSNEVLEGTGAKLINWYAPGLSSEERSDLRRKGLTADVLVAGSNAVTLGGELVNVDGTGNRVSAMVYGPKKVVIIVGVNKVVPDIDTAIKRIQMVAAPVNNKRLELPNPCTKTGVCMNCSGTTRICNVTTIMHKCPTFTDIHIIVVGEELGY